jgi:hypothetical protein
VLGMEPRALGMPGKCCTTQMVWSNLRNAI